MLNGVMEHLEPTQFDALFSLGEKVLVMFYADWCPFCQRFRPIFAAKSESTTNFKMYGAKVNDDNNPLWDRFSINAVPSVIAFDKGNIISRRDAKMGAGLNNSDLDSILKEVSQYPT
jgi:thioredoxin 1